MNLFRYLLCTAMLCIAPQVLASDIEFNFGGTINTVLMYDSNVAGIGVNIPGNSLLTKYQGVGESKLDATLSQLRFGTHQHLSSGDLVRTNVVMDFNNENDSSMSPRLREAYLAWTTSGGTLLAGQTWSTLMDMRNIPQSLVEPTLSGVVFKRQAMIRWSADLGPLKYDISLEGDSDNYVGAVGEYPRSTTLTSDISTPDLIGGLEWSSSRGWVRATGATSKVRVKRNNQTFDKATYGIQLSGGIQMTEQDKFTLLTNTGKGMAHYLLGLHATGPVWSEISQTIELQQTFGMMTSYTRQWAPKFKSVLAYGYVESDATQSQRWVSQDTFDNTQYAMANLIWNVEKELELGIEYNYSEYSRTQSASNHNHRMMVGVKWSY